MSHCCFRPLIPIQRKATQARVGMKAQIIQREWTSSQRRLLVSAAITLSSTAFVPTTPEVSASLDGNYIKDRSQFLPLPTVWTCNSSKDAYDPCYLDTMDRLARLLPGNQFIA